MEIRVLSLVATIPSGKTKTNLKQQIAIKKAQVYEFYILTNMATLNTIYTSYCTVVIWIRKTVDIEWQMKIYLHI